MLFCLEGLVEVEYEQSLITVVFSKSQKLSGKENDLESNTDN
jgi:hypothetical protein